MRRTAGRVVGCVCGGGLPSLHRVGGGNVGLSVCTGSREEAGNAALALGRRGKAGSADVMARNGGLFSCCLA